MKSHIDKPATLLILAICGLGGMLYGVDIGVIDPALPYLNRTVELAESELSAVVAAVLAGSILGSVAAGIMADLIGRRRMMIGSAVLFVLSVGLIFLSRSFLPLLAGRLLQGTSGGVIAVVAPLYLAETLPAHLRGRGTALFQFMLTLGIVLA
ncbi:MAG TPA: MFS transporter, partial [Telluria sp.]|nr:MFS transporter [Telluria sp.]